MIVIGGGDPDLRRRLAMDIGPRYNFSVQEKPLDDAGNETIIWGISDPASLRKLHAHGARIAWLREPDSEPDPPPFSSVSVDAQGAFQDIRRRLESALAGCC